MKKIKKTVRLSIFSIIMKKIFKKTIKGSIFSIKALLVVISILLSIFVIINYGKITENNQNSSYPIEEYSTSVE